jgi:tetratricopeptide (TPR) repeat protein
MEQTMKPEMSSRIGEGNNPTISLSLTVALPPYSPTDTSSRVLATINELAPYVDEVVMTVVSDSKSFGHSIANNHVDFKVLTICPSSHPHLFKCDIPSTFTGKSLCGEKYDTPQNGGWFVSDWGSLRNLGLRECSKDWVLLLRDREVLQTPQCLRRLCQLLEAEGKNIALGLSWRGPHGLYAARLCRNSILPTFEGIARESIEEGLRQVIIDGCLTVVTPEWSTEIERMLDACDYQALYADALSKQWDVDPVTLISLARTSHNEKFSTCLLREYLSTSLYPEGRSWAHALLGELAEKRKQFSEAAQAYQVSLNERPGWKSALRLCRVHHSEGEWKKSLAAYDMAMTLQPTYHTYDDGPESHLSSLIHVASSQCHLGMVDEARHTNDLLTNLFPNIKSVQEFCRSIT